MPQSLEFLRIFSKPILLVVLPFFLVLLGTDGRPLARKVGLVCAAGFVFISCYPIVAISVTTAVAMSEQSRKSKAVLMGTIYDGYEITNGNLHGLAGWQGVDIAAGCGAEIYAPFDGRVTHNGLDGYDTSKGQATMLTIRGDGIEVTLLHGDYLPGVGTAVSAGDVIGNENNHGYTEGPTGCHSHVILREGGQTLNYLDWMRGRPLRLAQAGQKPLKISWYDPAFGGVNCDSDCSTMASGQRVTDARYGRTAACIPEWTRARRVVVIPGLGRFECLDTGGAIKEHADFIWVDLLLHQPVAPFGTLIDEWYLE